MNTKIIIYLFTEVLNIFCSNISSLIDKAVYLTETNYKPEFVTTVIWQNNDTDDHINEFVQKYQKAIVLFSFNIVDIEKTYNFNKKFGFKQTIFFVTGQKEFGNVSAILREVIVIPIRLILVVTKRISEAELMEITKTAWKNDLANIVIIHKKLENKVSLITYYPYNENACNDTTPIELAHNAQIFPEKFYNMYKCPIRGSLLRLVLYFYFEMQTNTTLKSMTGIDGKFFHIVFEKLNASLEVAFHEDRGGMGNYFGPGNATGSFGDLYYKKADLLLPVAILNFYRYPVSQITHVCRLMNLLWLGPHRREVPPWIRIMMPFMSPVTTYLVGTFLAFVIITMIVKRSRFHTATFEYSVFFQSVIIFLGQEVDFESQSWLLNSLYMTFIWFCIILRFVYQGDLVDKMQSTILEAPLTTFEEAVKQVNEYAGTESLREFYRGTPYFSRYKLLKIPDIEGYILNVSRGSRNLVVSEALIMSQIDPLMQTIDSEITQVPMCVFMRPGWPLAIRVGTIVTRILEMGLWEKIYNEKRKIVPKSKMADRDANPLGMDILIGCFYGLGLMYLICLLVFVAEIMYFKVKSRPKETINSID